MSDWCEKHGPPLRVCAKCGKKAYSEKELELFKKEKRTKYGRSNLCKECHNKECILRQKRNFVKHRAYVHNYHLTHPVEEKAKAQRRLTKPGYWRNWYYNHKNECFARNKARTTIKITEPCTQCGTTENLTRHHYDYSKPLEVVILCRPCHTELHNKINLEKKGLL